jgi:2-phospho-L-lactate guanylyltransferase
MHNANRIYMDESQWALVPVKSLTWAKQRLEACLGSARADLTIAMLKDVLSALVSSRVIAQIAVVTADPRVADIASARGALVIDEIESRGMNEAIELGINAIKGIGGQGVAIIPADIPLMTGPEIDRVMHELQVQRQGEGEHITGIVPSKDRGGTNFLRIETSRSFSPMYGPDSYVHHTGNAREHGSRPVSLHSPPISLDIDEKKDLDEFISFCFSNPEFQATATWKFLQDNGYINSALQEEKVYGNE